jgi:hypothetical protein
MPRGTCAAASGAKGRVVGAEIGLITHERVCRSRFTSSVRRNFGEGRKSR